MWPQRKIETLLKQIIVLSNKLQRSLQRYVCLALFQMFQNINFWYHFRNCFKFVRFPMIIGGKNVIIVRARKSLPAQWRNILQKSCKVSSVPQNCVILNSLLLTRMTRYVAQCEIRTIIGVRNYFFVRRVLIVRFRFFEYCLL